MIENIAFGLKRLYNGGKVRELPITKGKVAENT
jgi:hypothetical protein